MADIKFDFHDKAVLVTGGTRGIGAATVRAFLAAGARVAVNGHTAESARRAVDQLGARAQAMAAPGDIGTVAGCRAAVEAALAAFGGLDVLVNNAGVFREVLMEDSDEAFWDQTININLKGTFFAAQAALPSLRQRRGNIVNVASESGIMGNPRCTVYCASKGGVVNLTRSMAIELAPEVRVNAVAPGPILWPDDESFDELSRQRIISNTPLRREGTPEDIAKAVYYLVAEAGYVTGETINVDGGRNIAI